jgi:hypothetical protein
MAIWLSTSSGMLRAKAGRCAAGSALKPASAAPAGPLASKTSASTAWAWVTQALPLWPSARQKASG